MTPESSEEMAQQLDVYARAVLERKAESLVVLDVRELTSVADAFLICSGRSNRQVIAIADSVQRTLKEQGIRPLSVEGKSEGHWVLMDYGDVVIHIFYETVREFYDLEGLWRDAEKVTTPSMEVEGGRLKAGGGGMKDESGRGESPGLANDDSWKGGRP